MDDTTEKIILVIISVLFGLIAGQGLRLFQAWWNTRKIKKSLRTELEDIRHRLNQMSDGYEQTMEFLAHNVIALSFPTKLSHPVFTKHYTDVFLKLTHTQRNSYELIHSLIDSINKVIEAEFALTEKEHNEELFKKWSHTIFSQHANIHLLLWHINYHLTFPENPDLIELTSETKKHFYENASIAKERTRKIVSNAKKRTLKETYARYGVESQDVKIIIVPKEEKDK